MARKKRLLIFTGIYVIVLLTVSTYFALRLIDKSAVASFKKLYSVYSQALLITVNDMDGDTGCYFSSDKHINSDFPDVISFINGLRQILR